MKVRNKISISPTLAKSELRPLFKRHKVVRNYFPDLGSFAPFAVCVFLKTQHKSKLACNKYNPIGMHTYNLSQEVQS